MHTDARPSPDPLVSSPTSLKRFASVQAAAIAGIVCAICWSISVRGLLTTPGIGASDEEITDFYAEPGAGRSALVFLQVFVVGTIAFLWFVGVIRSRLGANEPRLFGTVFLGGAILLAGLAFVGIAALAAPSVLVEVGGRAPDPGAASTIRAFAATVLSVFVPRITALVMFSTAALGRKTGALPRWLVILTYVVGVGELVNVTIRQPTIYVLPAWIALTSIVLLVRRPPQGFELPASRG